MNIDQEQELREKIKNLISGYYDQYLKPNQYSPGVDLIRYAGRVFDEQELFSLTDAMLDFWLTEGRFCREFAKKISQFLDIQHVILTNSGSSANLLALTALTSEKLGNRKLKKGDEVITVAAGFPSTVTPIIQNNMVPIFIDVELPTYNINTEQIRKAITDRTKCIIIAHTLGNPFDIKEILKLVEEYGLWLIEDNCDALGSRYNERFTGTFGHLATLSFYPAHHITTGEGGAVITNSDELEDIVRSLRDWGRDCYCASGVNNSCGKRFEQQFGSLPYGYDHKYVYSEIGYNLKMTDLQAAIGVAQIDKLNNFCDKRKSNFHSYQKIFSKYSDYFILPEATRYSDPAWFSFIVTLKKNAPFTRNDFVNYLESRKIETRNVFAGNITRQPAFINTNYRIAGNLNVTDYIMNNTFFLGTYPGMTSKMFDYIEKTIDDFFKDI